MGATHKLYDDDLVQLLAEEFAQRYKIVSKLGSGAFADVVRAKDLSAGRDCAVKVLRPSAAHPAGLQPEVALFREARALKHAKHPNVVGLSSVLRVPARGSGASQHGSCWGLLLEYVQGGSLAQVIYKQMVNPYPRGYSNTAALTWALDLAAAVMHLHSLSPCIIHRDLKLENILMQKPEVDAAAPATRKLPIAKISDFGLHVMLERPPCPYLITADGGRPVLLFGPELQQLQQQQRESHHDLEPCTAVKPGCADVGSSTGSDASVASTADALAGDKGRGLQRVLLQEQCSCRCCRSSRSSSLGAADGPATPDGAAGSAAVKLAAGAAVRSDKHVAFSACTRSLNGLQQQGQQLLSPFAAVAADASSANDQAGAATARFAARSDLNSSPTAQSDPLPGTAQQQQEQQQLQPLTTSALRRMSVDNLASSSFGCGIPLVLQPQGGPAGPAAYARVAVPASVMQRLSPLAAGSGCSGVDGCMAGALRARARSAVSGGGADDVSDILAAANMERDYEVSMAEGPDRSVSLGSCSWAPSLASSMHAGSISQPATPPGSTAAAAAGGGGVPLSLADISSFGGQPWDGVPAATAASVLWEDLMEDDGSQALLDGLGQAGCASGPLAYDLTQHTGSYMYMAPEIFRGEPYNESVDVFSLGVILYELFSRSLLLYTHTPANSPADSEAYAARVSRGFRPQRPNTFPAGVWRVVQRCWAADPTARPAASWVLQRLQQLLQAEEAAAAQAAMLRRGSGVVGVLNRWRRPGRCSVDAFAAAARTASTDCAVTIDSAAATAAGVAGVADAASACSTDSSAAAVAGSADASGASGDCKAAVVADVSCKAAVVADVSCKAAMVADVYCRKGLQDKPSPAARSTAGVAAGRVPPGLAEPACGCVIC